MNQDELSDLIVSTRLVSQARIAPVAQPAMRRCARCGISDAALGIELDGEGICNECRRFDRSGDLLAGYFRDEQALQTLLAGRAALRQGDYDCLLLYSGGKDSTYVLYKLIDMGLRVLTFTFDNGFISRQALDNIRAITTELGVEAIVAGHAEMRQVFHESLSRFSTVCKGCFKALLDLSLVLADQRGIGTIVTGLSRGQIVEERLKYFYERQQWDQARIEAELAQGRQVYHTMERFAGLDGKPFEDGAIFERVSLVDYFRYSAVTKAEIFAELRRRNLRWTQPTDTGFCSSNCLINDVGVSVHQEERGYSNYEVPTSWEVRLGHLERGAAVEELAGVSDQGRVDKILRHLKYVPRRRPAQPGLIAYCVLREGASLALLERTLARQLPAGVAMPRLVAVEAEAGEAAAAPKSAAGHALGPDRQALLQRDAAQWKVIRLRAPAPVRRAAVAQVLLDTLLREPALRLRLRQQDGEWWCEHPAPAVLPLSFLDLSQQAAASRDQLTERAVARQLAQLTEAAPGGPLLHLLALAPDAGGGTTLIVLVHQALAGQPAWQALADALPARPDAGSHPTIPAMRLQA